MLVLAPILVGAWLALANAACLAGVAMALACCQADGDLRPAGDASVLAIRIGATGDRIAGSGWRPAPRGRPGVVSAGLSSPACGPSTPGTRPTPRRSTTRPHGRLRRQAASRRSTAPGSARRTTAPLGVAVQRVPDHLPACDVTTRAGETVVSKLPTIDFRGALNPLLAGAIPLAFLFAGGSPGVRNMARALGVVWAARTTAVRRPGDRQPPDHVHLLLPAGHSGDRDGRGDPAAEERPAAVRMWGFLVAYAVGFAAYFPFRTSPDGRQTRARAPRGALANTRLRT